MIHAYQDLLDYDGMKSILREAGLLELLKVTSVDPNELIDFNILQKIINAHNFLLFGANELLKEIGRKFSLYLFPYGDNIENYINQLNECIQTDWKAELISISTSETNKIENVRIRVRNCVFKSNLSNSYEFSLGLLSQTIEKSIGASKIIDYKVIEENPSEILVEFYL